MVRHQTRSLRKNDERSKSITAYEMQVRVCYKFVHTLQKLTCDPRQASQNLSKTGHSTTAEARILSQNRSETVLDTTKTITKHRQGLKNEVGGVGAPVRSVKRTPKIGQRPPQSSEKRSQNQRTENKICDKARKARQISKNVQIRPWNCANLQKRRRH